MSRSSREIAGLLEQNVGSQRMSQVFEDFVETAALAFRNSLDRADPDAHERRENRYLQIAGSYGSDAMTRFGQALARVTLEMEQNPRDVLGELYMSLDLGNERLGQFFTPYDIARLMATMTISDLTRQIETSGTASLYEPACGAGGFVIAATQALREAGVNYQRALFVETEDVSITAVHMTYIQLTLLHVPALVHHCNTLTQETFDTWPTPAYVLGGWAARRNAQSPSHS